MQRPRPILLVALLAAAGTSVFALFGKDDPELVMPRARAGMPALSVTSPRPIVESKAATPRGGLRIAQRPVAPEETETRDIFEAYSWIPPPPAPPPEPPPPPKAPPVPFTYAGSIQIDGRFTYILIDGGKTTRLALGEQVGDFRLDGADGRGLNFVHLPTGLPQTLELTSLPNQTKTP